MPEDIHSRIAKRIKSLRIKRQMTLDQLAQTTQVSRAMLSLIERGESSPTAVLLEKVATGLGVTLAALFEDPESASNPLVRADERTSWCDPDTRYQRWNLSPPNYPSPLQLVKVILPSGARVHYETQQREGAVYQQIWVLQGSLKITLGDNTYLLHSDDCFAMQLNQTMTYYNPSQQDTHYLVAIANHS
ncbi:MAG: XRE family transcriptional regulator [Thiofilum sp.]|uniref:helix-turn-helix domain-containing protein n=1 Tax=Thiofilum sp. TaxID=2212733 RepID=UPI0025ED5592|nr:XRE family transcriptional regulator [Thiofilum sp.]MBK8453172.1 helix-turn-helix transcriptional regulator [Thiofilum sp.]